MRDRLTLITRGVRETSVTTRCVGAVTLEIGIEMSPFASRTAPATSVPVCAAPFGGGSAAGIVPDGSGAVSVGEEPVVAAVVACGTVVVTVVVPRGRVIVGVGIGRVGTVIVGRRPALAEVAKPAATQPAAPTAAKATEARTERSRTDFPAIVDY